MSSLIVPVNFSAASSNAASYAAHMAAEQKSEMHLLHVIMIQPSITHAPLPDNLMQQMKDDATFNMVALAERLRMDAPGDLEVHTHIEWGTVEQQVEQLAKRKAASFVVMGISPESAQKVIFQSNAFSALKVLQIPLVIVPEGAGFTPWKKIAIAYDFSDSLKDLPLKAINAMPALKESEVHIVYVRRKNEAEPSHSAMQEVRENFDGANLHFHLIEADSVDAGVSDYVERHKTDLLVLLPKHHSFFEFHKSESKRLLKHLSVPMLSVQT